MKEAVNLARQRSVRGFVQAGWALLTNGHLTGFWTGRLYQGSLKQICVPGLNCYSCPGSLGACPIGALQAVLGKAGYRFSYYLAGFFLLMGGVLGRFVCGFLCPFGWIQELLHRIPLPKGWKERASGFRFDRTLRWLKYIILVVFVIALPLTVVNAVGGGSPWFCQWICPAGTLEAGIPLAIQNPMIRAALGLLFSWKAFILAITVAASILIARPFCKYVCPLGAIYGLFNRVAIFRYYIDANKCTSCGACRKHCPMRIDPARECNHIECVRCGNCRRVCPAGAIGCTKACSRGIAARRDNAEI
ncbi:MAG: 4Fe-4S binding protein [Oscillospiraceae bacterium]|jgi:ferredoxin|nr:4Fe-4S binding protein [Oscillospiraceae bacterium]